MPSNSHENRRAAAHLVARLDAHFARLAGGDQHVGPRAELDHAEPLAFLHRVADLEPADDAAGNRTGDLLDADGPIRALFLHVDPELFVADGARWVAGVEKRSGEIANVGDSSSPRQAIDMHVEDRQEDADPQRPAKL